MVETKQERRKVLVGGGPSKVRSIRLPVSYWRAIKTLSKSEGTSVNGEIVKAVQLVLRDEGLI